MKVRRAHMVSRGYLDPWADQKGRVDVIDIEQGRGFKATINNATVVSYVYEPSVLTVNLEAEFGRIESAATPVFVKLREGAKLGENDKRSVIKFLDMHLERGRYADQAKISTPALVLKTGGRVEEVELKLSDRLLLTRYMDGPIRLSTRGLENWSWTLYKRVGLVTGDGAVLSWRETETGDLCTVTFPISPTQMLVIGKEIPLHTPINDNVVKASRRWLVGEVDALPKDQSAIAAFRRSTEERAEEGGRIY